MNFSQVLGTVPAHLHYVLEAVNDHSIHSPFAYNFFSRVIKGSYSANILPLVEDCRSRMKSSSQSIVCSEYGAGSRKIVGKSRKISSIARNGISKVKTCRLLKSIVDFYKPQKVIELGTSLGIGSMYLADHPGTQVHTFEGCEGLADLSMENFKSSGYNNIKVHLGDINSTLPKFLLDNSGLDVVYIDANHRSDALINYFQLFQPRMASKSIVVVDDIRWSIDMFRGWRRLIKDEHVNLSFDLGVLGLLIIEGGYPRQHFVAEY